MSFLNENFVNIVKLIDQFDEIDRLTHGMPDITVPRIVVIGDQSKGKSSMLESMSGVDLPLGVGTCTRVPVILQLRTPSANLPTGIKIRAITEDGIEICEDIKDESEISDVIVKYTEKLAGNGKGIRDLPITLTIVREDLVNLTIIDLPGIVHNDIVNKMEVCNIA